MVFAKLQSVVVFISHLSKREKLIAYAVIVFISIAALDRLIISPIFSKTKSLQDAIAEKETSIKRSARILAQKDRIATESVKYSTFMTSSLSEEEETTSILKELETIASASSIYLQDMKPGGVQTIGVFKKYTVTLNCEAQMEQLVEFIYNIESSKKLLTVGKFEISPKAQKSTIAKCTLTVYKMTTP